MDLDRVILHLDMDCFYCQVEQVRLNLDSNVPLAVQQGDNVIAVNYPARAANVNRHSSYKDCFEKCPPLKLVHVPTFSTHSPGAGLKMYQATSMHDTISPDRTSYKASLQPYRQASLKVFSTLRTQLLNTGCSFVLEKASIDEVYFDVSDIIDARMQTIIGIKIAKGKIAAESIGLIKPLGALQFVGIPAVNDEQIFTADTCRRDSYLQDHLNNLRIALGSQLAQFLRNAVFEDLKYTVSAGIAHNKTLAKLASAKNKPNKQTYVTSDMVAAWMAIVPFNKIRYLGGKLGKTLETSLQGKYLEDEVDEEPLLDEESSIDKKDSTTNAIMAKDLWKLSLEDLKQELGDLDSAKWAYRVIRGQDDSPVAPRLQSKSFMAAKELRPPIKEWSVLHDWIILLCTELAGRLEEEVASNKRWPQTLTIHFKRPAERNRSKAIDFPFEPSQINGKLTQLADICINQLGAENRELSIFPCSRIALAVGRFKSYYENERKRASTLDEFIRVRTVQADSPGTVISAPAKNLVKKPKSDIRSFFKSDEQSKDSGKSNWHCGKCRESFEASDIASIQEHEDYHFALELQKSIMDGEQ